MAKPRPFPTLYIHTGRKNGSAGEGESAGRKKTEKMTVLQNSMLTSKRLGPYNPLTQRGRFAAGAAKFALLFFKESRL